MAVIIKEALANNTLYKYKTTVKSLFLHVLDVRDIVLNIVEGTNDLDIKVSDLKLGFTNIE